MLKAGLIYEGVSIKDHFPAKLNSIIERISNSNSIQFKSGYKLSTMKFKKGSNYHGNLRENCTFFQLKTIDNPHDDTDKEIN